MTQPDDLAQMQARIEALENQNRSLLAEARGSSRAARRVRPVLAALLVVLAVLLAPISVLGSWARFELVEADRFAQTFGPLAEKPEVRAFITDQVVTAIDAGVDIDALVEQVFDGLGSLDLPPKAVTAVGMLQGPAAQGVRTMVRDAVEELVSSPQFARLWEAVLRQTHEQAVAVIQGDPDAALQLSSDGTLSLQLGAVIQTVKQELLDQGMSFASLIPQIERSIPILTSDSLLLARAVYQVAVAAGTWLPWLTLGLLAAGIAVARQRLRALAWAAAGLTLSLLLLAGGLGIGKAFFVGAVSPSIMPAPTAAVLFAQLTELMSSVTAALIVLSVLLMVGAWLFGASKPAVGIRTAGDRGLSRVRAAADRAGLDPRGFGRVLDRWRPAVLVIAVVLTVLAIVLSRPLSTGRVLGALSVLLVVMLLVELMRRPLVPAEVRDRP